MPGFTPISMFPRMWAATGVSYPELVDRLVAGAADRRCDAPAGSVSRGRRSPAGEPSCSLVAARALPSRGVRRPVDGAPTPAPVDRRSRRPPRSSGR